MTLGIGAGGARGRRRLSIFPYIVSATLSFRPGGEISTIPNLALSRLDLYDLPIDPFFLFAVS